MRYGRIDIELPNDAPMLVGKEMPYEDAKWGFWDLIGYQGDSHVMFEDLYGKVAIPTHQLANSIIRLREVE